MCLSCARETAFVARYDFTSCEDGFCGYAWPHGSQICCTQEIDKDQKAEIVEENCGWLDVSWCLTGNALFSQYLKASRLPANPWVFVDICGYIWLYDAICIGEFLWSWYHGYATTPQAHGLRPWSLAPAGTTGPAMAIPAETVQPHHAKLLEGQGWVVIEGFIPETVAVSLRTEAAEAFTAGKFTQHRFQFGAGTFEKPNIFEADLHDEELHEFLPAFADLLFDDSLSKQLNDLLPELQLEEGPKAKTLKLQHNAGKGGCFPCHYDNSGRPSKRRITCLVYLNPDWKDGDGGELVLHPFLQPEVVIAPLLGRAVLFRSDLLLHSVRPAMAARFCFTIWLDSTTTNRNEECNLTAKALKIDVDNVEFLKHSPLQRAISRAVYAEEYEDSLLACMSGTPGCTEMLEGHQQHVAQQLSHTQLGPFLQHLRELKRLKSADVVYIQQPALEITWELRLRCQADGFFSRTRNLSRVSGKSNSRHE